KPASLFIQCLQAGFGQPTGLYSICIWDEGSNERDGNVAPSSYELSDVIKCGSLEDRHVL
ncbi:unnamed protein product, partial [Heterotrigona itama]